MDQNAFCDKEIMPDNARVSEKLGPVYSRLEEIRQHLSDTLGETREEWKFYGVKHGWNLKTFFKKRNLFFIVIYEGYFLIGFVFGEKAFQAIKQSNLSAELKSQLEGARKYGEGRGLGIEVKDSTYLEDIKKLVRFKIEN